MYCYYNKLIIQLAWQTYYNLFCVCILFSVTRAVLHAAKRTTLEYLYNGEHRLTAGLPDSGSSESIRGPHTSIRGRLERGSLSHSSEIYQLSCSVGWCCDVWGLTNDIKHFIIRIQEKYEQLTYISRSRHSNIWGYWGCAAEQGAFWIFHL